MRTVPHGPLLSLLVCAARIRPLQQPARSVMNWARAAELIPRYVEGRVNGCRIALDLNESVDQKLLLFGAWDKRGLGLIKRVMEAIDCDTAVDVGANIGNHTAYFAEWARHVVAIEPNPPVFERLERFVSHNRLENVTAVSTALSDRSGALNFYVYPGQAHLATLEESPGATKAGNIPVERGDELLGRIGARHIDFIKIDVEGHESEVLSGLGRTIATDKPVLSIEFVGTTIAKYGSADAFAAALPGYAIYGTRTSLLSRLFKTALSLERFQFGKKYTHVLCVPRERGVALTKLTGTIEPVVGRIEGEDPAKNLHLEGSGLSTTSQAELHGVRQPAAQ
jgi:FkbM family methyltransferase